MTYGREVLRVRPIRGWQATIGRGGCVPEPSPSAGTRARAAARRRRPLAGARGPGAGPGAPEGPAGRGAPRARRRRGAHHRAGASRAPGPAVGSLRRGGAGLRSHRAPLRRAPAGGGRRAPLPADGPEPLERGRSGPPGQLRAPGFPRLQPGALAPALRSAASRRTPVSGPQPRPAVAAGAGLRPGRAAGLCPADGAPRRGADPRGLAGGDGAHRRPGGGARGLGGGPGGPDRVLLVPSLHRGAVGAGAHAGAAPAAAGGGWPGGGDRFGPAGLGAAVAPRQAHRRRRRAGRHRAGSAPGAVPRLLRRDGGDGGPRVGGLVSERLRAAHTAGDLRRPPARPGLEPAAGGAGTAAGPLLRPAAPRPGVPAGGGGCGGVGAQGRLARELAMGAGCRGGSGTSAAVADVVGRLLPPGSFPRPPGAVAGGGRGLAGGGGTPRPRALALGAGGARPRPGRLRRQAAGRSSAPRPPGAPDAPVVMALRASGRGRRPGWLPAFDGRRREDGLAARRPVAAGPRRARGARPQGSFRRTLRSGLQGPGAASGARPGGGGGGGRSAPAAARLSGRRAAASGWRRGRGRDLRS